MHMLFEQFENAGLLTDSGVNFARIGAMSVTEILDAAAQAVELTVASPESIVPGTYSHSATISLGGGRHPCGELGCRIGRVAELAQFAVLYSDRVYFRNFLADYASHSAIRGRDESDVRRYFSDDLSLLARMRPLIEAGRLVPMVPARNRCLHCLAKASFGHDADLRLQSEYRRIERAFYREATISIEKRGPYYAIRASGPESLFEHGRSYLLTRVPNKLLGMPRLLAQVEAGKSVQLGRDSRRAFGHHTQLTREVFHSISFELASANILGTSYLTERPLHAEILGSLSGDPELATRNQLIEQHLASIVPFLSDVPLDGLLKLRERESESFLMYRQALNKAVDEVRESKGRFGTAEARALYSDVIAPELARLNVKVASATQDLRLVTAGKAAGWVGAISFGLYTGLLPAGIAAAAKAFGMVKAVGGITDTVVAAGGKDKAVRTEDLFFLWKVRQLAKP